MYPLPSVIAAFAIGSIVRGKTFLSKNSRQVIRMSHNQPNHVAGRSGNGRGQGSGRGRKSPRPDGTATPPGRGHDTIVRGGRGRSERAQPGGRTSKEGRGGRGVSPGRTRATPSKANGVKGAEIHTVSESDRIRLTRSLMTLRESNQKSTTFSPLLTNTERKFVHSLSMQLGLVSKSHGKGENRCITVSKRADKIKNTGNVDEIDETFPTLHVGKRGIAALKQHVLAYPPTDTEHKESYDTGSSLIGESNDEMVNVTLSEMGLSSSHIPKKAVMRQVRIDLNFRAQQHADAQRRKVAHPMFHRMQEQRKKLPAWTYQEAICSTVSKNAVTVLSGETGCGKSTQVPQFLLDNDPTASIVVTQPRRISAISVAERIASEQCLEPIGGMVGYQIRLESALSKSTQLLFLTPGVLLRKLQSSPTLAEYTYVIIDEIHERDKYTEFLLIALRDLLPSRPDLRIILMSATMQTQTLIDYWYDAGGNGGGAPGQISIPGRTFPVQEYFLEDILTMTKFLDEKTIDTTDQLEAAMTMLLAKKNLSPPAPNKNQREITSTSERNKAPPYPRKDGPSFSCIMCNTSGFSNPEELGEHIAFCDGGAGESMAALDNRVRKINIANGAPNNTLEYENIDESLFDDYDISDENESEDSELVKWDGESAFDMSASEAITSEEEENLLAQYQALHDDEKIDDALLLEVLQLIVKSSYGDGAILVFLPGWGEISEITTLLERTPPFHNRKKYLILPLHSGILSKDQRKVFQKPPSGVRKIILSTNIAETSVTIEDVSFVIDTGRAKEKNYDPHLKTSTLAPTWVSQASAKQRKGRAGRTKRGVAFRLYSRRRHSSFRPFVESELLRTPLVSRFKIFVFVIASTVANGDCRADAFVPVFRYALSTFHRRKCACRVKS